jgi:Sec-independent protein secretion pathway component TatC
MGNFAKRDLAGAAGICTIVGAVTAHGVKKKWEDIHTAAMIVGAVLTIVGVAN